MTRHVFGLMVMVALATSGCGGVPTATPSSDGGSSSPLRPDTGEAPLFSPGLWTGTQTCTYRGTVAGQTASQPQSRSESLTVGADGLPEGLGVGQSRTTVLGPSVMTTTYTNVNIYSNGMTVEGSVTLSYNCSDTCLYARDGVCDEISRCGVGTDCGDCGQLILTGSSWITFKRLASGQMGFTSFGIVSDRSAFVTSQMDCSATFTH
jgi:hypothetical protein